MKTSPLMLALLLTHTCNAATNIWSVSLTNNLPNPAPFPPAIAVDGYGGCAIAWPTFITEGGVVSPGFLWINRAGKVYFATNFLNTETSIYHYLNADNLPPRIIVTPTRLVFKCGYNDTSIVFEFTRTSRGIVQAANVLAPTEWLGVGGSGVPTEATTTDSLGFFTLDSTRGVLRRYRY